MKRLKKLSFGLIVMIAVGGFATIVPRVSAANIIVHIGPEAAPAGVVYHYTYYPEEEVYYVPETQVYWWQINGEWRSGARVPAGITLGASVNFDADGREPWRHHDVIIAKFPRHKHEERH
jgi:hypothetical protein